MPLPGRTAPAPALPPPTFFAALAEAAFLALLPGGGQQVARRNAWAGMSASAARAREQREADAAVDEALRRAGRRRPSRQGAATGRVASR